MMKNFAKQSLEQKIQQSPREKISMKKTISASTKNIGLQLKDKKGSPRLNVKQISQETQGLSGGQNSPSKILNIMTPRL